MFHFLRGEKGRTGLKGEKRGEKGRMLCAICYIIADFLYVAALGVIGRHFVP